MESLCLLVIPLDTDVTNLLIFRMHFFNDRSWFEVRRAVAFHAISSSPAFPLACLLASQRTALWAWCSARCGEELPVVGFWNFQSVGWIPSFTLMSHVKCLSQRIHRHFPSWDRALPPGFFWVRVDSLHPRALHLLLDFLVALACSIACLWLTLPFSAVLSEEKCVTCFQPCVASVIPTDVKNHNYAHCQLEPPPFRGNCLWNDVHKSFQCPPEAPFYKPLKKC